MFREYITEARGPGGPQGNFNLSTGVSDKDYGDAMSRYKNKTMEDLAKIAKKFKAEGEPEKFQPSGVANDGYKLLLYTGKAPKSSEKKPSQIWIKYYSPRQSWAVYIDWGVYPSGSASTSSSEKLSDLSVSQVEQALQNLANKFPEFEQDSGRFGKDRFFPVKFKAVFGKRIPAN